MNLNELPLPPHYDKSKAGKVWKVNYESIAGAASEWAQRHGIKPSAKDKFKVCLLAVDMQNTFCLPDFELFAAGRSGTGAVDDTIRLSEFIYKNLNVITDIIPTMDTHRPIQIFHQIFLINDKGEHPEPYSQISVEDVKSGTWKVNPEACLNIGIDPNDGNDYLLHYTEQLKESGKYSLTVWPYHAMLGGISYSLVSLLEEAIFFHSVARYSQPDHQIKGSNPLTEHYSVFGPEVKSDKNGDTIEGKNKKLIDRLLAYDAVIIAGEAKSHCVAWTIEDLLSDLLLREKGLTGKVYLLEDCTSPVVIHGGIDFTDEADAAFKKFEAAGMHVVKSTGPMENWPGLKVIKH
jgi:nicotinamidase-related amidase